MSRTHHHSRNWNRANPMHRDSYPDRYWAAQTPSHWTRLMMHKPGRAKDRVVIHRMLAGKVDIDAATFERTGNHKPHVYYW